MAVGVDGVDSDGHWHSVRGACPSRVVGMQGYGAHLDWRTLRMASDGLFTISILADARCSALRSGCDHGVRLARPWVRDGHVGDGQSSELSGRTRAHTHCATGPTPGPSGSTEYMAQPGTAVCTGSMPRCSGSRAWGPQARLLRPAQRPAMVHLHAQWYQIKLISAVLKHASAAVERAERLLARCVQLEETPRAS